MWKNYDEYLQRLQLINEDIEYTEEQLNKIKELYLNNTVKDHKMFFIDDICNEDSNDKILNKILKCIQTI